MGCPRPFPEHCSQLWWLLYLIEQVQAEGLLSTARPVVWEHAEAMLYFYIPDLQRSQSRLCMCFFVRKALHIAYRSIGSDVVGYWWHGCRQSSCAPWSLCLVCALLSIMLTQTFLWSPGNRVRKLIHAHNDKKVPFQDHIYSQPNGLLWNLRFTQLMVTEES